MPVAVIAVLGVLGIIALGACAPSPGHAPAQESSAAPRLSASTGRPPTTPQPRSVAADGGTDHAGPAAVQPASSCVDDGEPYDPIRLRAWIAQLAAPALDGRASGSPGDVAARAIIAERFRCLGLVPAGVGGSYEQPFIAEGQATANVVGYLPGDDPGAGGDIIIVGAHHDHLGDGHLGANDNASGVGALLAIAQAVRQHGGRHRTIGFVAFGGEELGLVGSTYFAAHPPDELPLARVVYDINLDMVGSYAEAGAVYAMGTFGGLPATALVKALAAEPPALHVGTGGRGSGSDHEAFCAAGVPYVFFWTPDKRCYHKRCDVTEQLDVAHLARIAALAGTLVERLADSPSDLARSRRQHGCTGR